MRLATRAVGAKVCQRFGVNKGVMYSKPGSRRLCSSSRRVSGAWCAKSLHRVRGVSQRRVSAVVQCLECLVLVLVLGGLFQGLRWPGPSFVQESKGR